VTPVIVIPAFEPGGALLATVAGIRGRLAAPVVVIDDGSGRDFAPVFRHVSGTPGVTLLAHPHNRGKGQALRTGIEHVLRAHPTATGVVTADADGQHAVEDIAAVVAAHAAHPDKLVLGARHLGAGAPLGNRIGNACARWLIRLATGRTLIDSQTGLRGIPRGLLPALVALRSSRYEFETEMLLCASALGVELHEHPIRAIYAGAPSHFHAVADSARIARVAARFVLAAARGRRDPRVSP
jgi:glycosyltransferase involved in cell wall biosynthesis